ncbi:aspartate--tRNA ligase [Orientia chuto str. Dubai]|uniref:Aspartate--tRNA(Asp/Asn) ligase n=1 Tax=Orientia chuto str. Dubai TaxID=1359168 RepID=A0A0F3MQ47_9RICK|nr:aspartate--tRNA ligase [Candidatus Orientia mediorientalis]KJV57552.1 aspartate--tRNA ligase [Orientia chuto str. Dubai]
MHKYRTHTCGELSLAHVGLQVKLSGWLYRRRNHGGLLFIDLRDHYGITQLVFNNDCSLFQAEASKVKFETVITVKGTVVARSSETINKNISTGTIEVVVNSYSIESLAEELPLQINGEYEAPEETRLKYRFLDLRRDKLHKNIILRSQVIQELRNQMLSQGFIEFQTPILTASSPEGARDFLVPSRLHPGKFYALPQAPQQFKQLIMISGFDKYFQIAPCFRDEDARADRSPGEFYQLDIEMSFVTQEDVFNLVEPVLYNTFRKFSHNGITNIPFPRITYNESMLRYGSDKPDLRNPIQISDVTDIFKYSDFTALKNSINIGAVVRAIPALMSANKSRGFFDKIVEYAKQLGASGLAYIKFTSNGAKGPIVKFLNDALLVQIKKVVKCQDGDAVFFICDKENDATKIAAKIRAKLGEELNIIETDCYKFCWVIDFPFFQFDSKANKITFSHNPFSMPQGGINALNQAKTVEDLLRIKAFQYDIVCNGIEISSGAIRNHQLDLMYKAFAIAGYTKDSVKKQFEAMIKALSYGAPPHGGIAPGIDRIIMLLTNAVNIREVIAFPMNQQAEDLLMCAPAIVGEQQLQELQLKLISK